MDDAVPDVPLRVAIEGDARASVDEIATLALSPSAFAGNSPATTPSCARVFRMYLLITPPEDLSRCV